MPDYTAEELVTIDVEEILKDKSKSLKDILVAEAVSDADNILLLRRIVQLMNRRIDDLEAKVIQLEKRNVRNS